MKTEKIQALIEKTGRDICFFDVETTGVNVVEDRIVQICVTKLKASGEIIKRTRLINPSRPIPSMATAVHGITNEMVAKEHTFAKIAKALAEFMQGCDFAGYNIKNFDVPLLAYEFERAKVKDPFEGCMFFDMFAMFCGFYPRNLTACYLHYCNKQLVAHDAENDTLATVEIFEAMFTENTKELLNATPEEVEALSISKKETVDLFGHFSKDEDGDLVFAFGKNKGLKLKAESNYCKWILSSDFPQRSKDIIHKELARK
jgi:DNA polymerase III subunit epsilon